MSALTRLNQTELFQLRRLAKSSLTVAQIAERMKVPAERITGPLKKLRTCGFALKEGMTERDCLKCSEPFPSAWNGNRICGRCRAAA